MRPRWLLALLLFPAAVSAQDKHSDPLPADDPVFALVDPADHPGQDYVFLLEDGTYRVGEDGRTTFRLHQVVQVLTNQGASEWGEYTFRYNPERQEISLDWMRVISDGRVVRDGPEHQQESSRPVDQNAPVYDDTRFLQATLAGVRPGAIIDYQITFDTHLPRLPGDYSNRWDFNGFTHVVRSDYTFEAPSSERPRILTGGPIPEAEVTEAAGWTTRSWSARDLEPIAFEPFAGSPNDVVQYVRISSPIDWEDLGSFYAQYLTDDDALSDELIAAHDKQLVGATTLRDSIAATYRWVAQDFRYVSLALGDGGYRPRAVQDVFETGFGDCKDKTSLFVALVRRLGVDAQPVLVDSDGGVIREAPGMSQFDHMIAAVHADNGTTYADLTTILTPYGELPQSLQGSLGLRVSADGDSELVTLPESATEENIYSKSVVGSIDRQNRFVGSITISASGTEQYGLREAFYDFDALEPADKEEILRSVISGVWEGARVDSSAVFDGSDLSQDPTITVWFTVDDILGDAGGRYLLYLPVSRFADETSVTEVTSDSERAFPIDVAQVNSPSVFRSAAEISLPAAWKVAVPATVSVDGDFGYYHGRYRQDGNTLYVTREMGGLRGLQPPERADDLADWFRSVAGDDTRYVLINPATEPITVGTAEHDAALAGILIGPEDLGAGAILAADGTSRTFDMFEMVMAEPIRSHDRDIAARQMVFAVGESQMIMLSLRASEHYSVAEAEKGSRVFDLVNLGSLMSAGMAQMTGAQASVGRVTDFDLPGLGNAFRGWHIPLVTPMATIDLVFGILTRGRVSVIAFAWGVQGARAEDLSTIFTTMDARIQANPDYLRDIERPESTEHLVDPAEVAERAGGFPLDLLLPKRDAYEGAVATEVVMEANGVPTFGRNFNGSAFTFPVEGSEVISASFVVDLLTAPEWAVKRIEMNRQTPPESLIGLDNLVGLDGGAGGEGDEYERLDDVAEGALSTGTIARLSSMFHIDVGTVLVARGRSVARIELTAPPGELDEASLRAVATHFARRVGEVDPEAASFEPPEELVREVAALVQAEKELNDALGERDFDVIWDRLEGVSLDYTAVTYEPQTFNLVCWYGALEGHAERVLPYCEAALVPDPDDFSRRDSRALARALAGERDGAIEDFAWVVDHSVEGQFHSLRAEWLRSLRAGEDPFTEEVLDQLKN